MEVFSVLLISYFVCVCVCVVLKVIYCYVMCQASDCISIFFSITVSAILKENKLY